MSDSYRRFYRQSQFTSLVGGLTPALPILKATLGALVLTVPVGDVRLNFLDEIVATVEWAGRPTDADLLTVDVAIAAFVGGLTTSEPFQLESFGATQSNSATPVLKATLATGPLDGGTYTFSWNSLLRMNPAGANSGVEGRVRISRSDGIFREQPDAWDLAAQHAFNGNIIFTVIAGQTLTATAHVLRLGSAGVAEMLGLRFTIDQLAPVPSV